MKTLAELKQMSFIPHHDCNCCGVMVGWVVSKDALKPYFDPSCDCGGSGGHYDTWEDVFKWYNTVFEKETEDAVQSAWNKEAKKINADEYERINSRIAELEEERRWRKFSEEKPKEKQWILVFYPNHSQFTTGVELRRWVESCKYDVEEQKIYEKWMPLPSAPKETK